MLRVRRNGPAHPMRADGAWVENLWSGSRFQTTRRRAGIIFPQCGFRSGRRPEAERELDIATIAVMRDRRRRQRRGKVAAPKGSARLDIQGMRALAVLLVFADHLFWTNSGGFIGVDVFFVISGYLITGLLVREGERKGRPSIREFYARRVRRIIPVALLVLITTNIMARQLFAEARANDTQTDSIWALLFGANIRFSNIGTDYFQRDRPPSPVQHFWSLSVEEQFYVVWPLLIILAFLLAARLGFQGRRLVLPLAVLGSAASFAWCIHQTTTNPTVAYFSTSARAWELGLGAVLAIGQAQITRLPTVVRSGGAWVGLGAIVAATLLISDTTPFPGWAAVLPVIGAGLILAADDPHGGPGQIGILNNPAARYVGDLSYSIYLWHFPVIVLATAKYPDKGAEFYLIAALLPFALSMLSYHLLEDPIRRSRWLSKKPRGYERRSLSRWQADNQVTLNGLLAVFAVVTLVFVASAMTSNGRPLDPSAGFIPAPIAPALADSAMTLPKLQRQISVALDAKTWPGLYPTMDKAISGGQSTTENSKCSSPDRQDDPCSWGPTNAPHRALLLGDSIAMTYLEPVKKAVTARSGWNLTGMALYGCLFGNAKVKSLIPEVVKTCDGQADREVAFAQRLKPDIIFVSYSYEVQLNTEDYAASTRDLIERLTPLAKKVVFLAPPPADKTPSECYTPSSKPSDCVSGLTSGWSRDNAAQRAVIEETGAIYVGTLPLFCDQHDRCPTFVGTTPVKRDQKHMTPQYESLIGRSLGDLLVKYKVLSKI